MLERGDNPERGGGVRWVDIEIGRLPLFYYFTVRLHFLCVWGKVKFPLLHFDSSVFGVNDARIPILVVKVLKHCIICIFLIHSDSIQEMLTALFI